MYKKNNREQKKLPEEGSGLEKKKKLSSDNNRPSELAPRSENGPLGPKPAEQRFCRRHRCSSVLQIFPSSDATLGLCVYVWLRLVAFSTPAVPRAKSVVWRRSTDVAPGVARALQMSIPDWIMTNTPTPRRLL